MPTPLLELVSPTLRRTHGHKGALPGEYINHTSCDFIMDNRFVVFAYNIDPEFL